MTDSRGVLEADERERLCLLEERVARLEAQLGLSAETAPALPNLPPPALAPVFSRPQGGEEELEFEIGQNWFAIAGIFVLTAGVAFMLSLRHERLPAALPAAAGFGLALGVLAAAHAGERAFAVVAGYLRAAAMILLGFSVLRLFYFGASPALDVRSVAGRGFLLAAIGANIGIGLWRRSPWLTALSLPIAAALALAAGSGWFVLLVVAGMGAVTIGAGRQAKWALLSPFGMGVCYLTYFLWSSGEPFRSGRMHFTPEPAVAPALLFALMVGFGLAPLLRLERRGDDALMNVTALLNCALGYGVFLLHTAAAFPAWFAGAHLLATLGFLAIAIVFFLREQSRVSTFFYAMTGYAALSLALVKLSAVPQLFVWLSVQSVVVVTTAIWFRSRFIVVANFFIFVGIALAYLMVAGRETGISIGFGIVALVSARILNWQRDRLELKTALMRNAYLVSAFLVFPYALYHLVSPKFAAVAWVGLAGVYYLLNVIVQNQKYRWMGHATLGLATLYVVSVGVSRFEPVYRVLSFLVLGTVLLLVSLSFTRARRKQTSQNQ